MRLFRQFLTTQDLKKENFLWVKNRLAVDMDIHGYIHVWISDFSHPVDISMDIVLSHLLIKLNI